MYRKFEISLAIFINKTLQQLVISSEMPQIVIKIYHFQILIGSIMCGYSKEDWIELAKMTEVRLCCVILFHFSREHLFNFWQRRHFTSVYCYESFLAFWSKHHEKIKRLCEGIFILGRGFWCIGVELVMSAWYGWKRHGSRLWTGIPYRIYRKWE
jgi:hypothetical protein